MLYSKTVHSWRELEGLIGDNPYTVLLTVWDNAKNWSIIEFAEMSGGEIGVWIFKRMNDRTNAGIMVLGGAIWHIKRNNDGSWFAKPISLAISYSKVTNHMPAGSSLSVLNNCTGKWNTVVYSNSSKDVDAGTILIHSNVNGYATELHVRNGELLFQVYRPDTGQVIGRQVLATIAI